MISTSEVWMPVPLWLFRHVVPEAATGSVPFVQYFLLHFRDSQHALGCSLIVSPPPYLIEPLPSPGFHWAVFIDTSTDGRTITRAKAVVCLGGSEISLRGGPWISVCKGNHQGSRRTFTRPLPQSQGAHSRGCRLTPFAATVLALGINWALERSSEHTQK